jgi:hypothetical protein
VDSSIREFVRQRAGNLCEYCRVHQRFYPDFTFHVEHIIARQHGGTDSIDNLAYSCHLCNSKKGPNLASLSPKTGELTRLFNPRIDIWEEHFRISSNGEIIGTSDIGVVTANLLAMNSAVRMQIRQEIIRLENNL